MSRVALITKTKLISAVALLFVAGGTIIGLVQGHSASQKPIVAVQNSQTTDVKYHGINGQNALALLKKYASVETKHYSFGDQVTSINGSVGNGPKYWSFYVNGKLSDVGADSYVTKDNDQIEWKLQSL